MKNQDSSLVTAEEILEKNLRILYYQLSRQDGVAFAWNDTIDYIRSLQTRNKELEAENTRLRAIIEAEPTHCGWCSEGKDGKCEGLLVAHYPKP